VIERLTIDVTVCGAYEPTPTPVADRVRVRIGRSGRLDGEAPTGEGDVARFATWLARRVIVMV
jgi:hypothetical protein